MSAGQLSGIFFAAIYKMNFIELRSFDNYIEANIVLGMLQDAGINCHLKDEHIITIDPLLSPAIGGMKLMVHESHVKRAWEVMEAAEKKYLATIPCPICKKHTLETITLTKRYKTLLGALGSMFLTGQPVQVKKQYRCKSCGYDFKELPKRNEFE